jgi:FkbM family methyltransferase
MALLPRFVRQGDVCVDAGANVGRYTVALSRLVGRSGAVLAFEPGSYAFQVLSLVVRFLRLRNVVPHRVALGERPGDVALAVPRLDGSPLADTESAHVMDTAEEGVSVETVRCVPLDDFAADLSGRRVTFVKCDVEGAELFVLRGALCVLREHRPVVLCEVAERLTARYGHRPSDVFDALAAQGYDRFVLRQGRLDAAGSGGPDGGNYWFLPRGGCAQNCGS